MRSTYSTVQLIRLPSLHYSLISTINEKVLAWYAQQQVALADISSEASLQSCRIWLSCIASFLYFQMPTRQTPPFPVLFLHPSFDYFHRVPCIRAYRILFMLFWLSHSHTSTILQNNRLPPLKFCFILDLLEQRNQILTISNCISSTHESSSPWHSTLTKGQPHSSSSVNATGGS